MKMPSDWIKPVTAAATKPQAKVEARIDMSADVAGEGLCPECRKPMETTLIDDAMVLVCMKDRITLPIKDEAVPETSDAETAADPLAVVPPELPQDKR